MTVGHSYNAGDLITILPGLRELWIKTQQKVTIYQRIDLPAYYFDSAKHPTVNNDGTPVSMNRDIFNRLKPLLLQQGYIEDFKEWKGEQVDFDFSETRDRKSVPMPHGSIHHWWMITFPQMQTNLSRRWLYGINDEGGGKNIIINRTDRYYNPMITYYFLKDYDDVWFAGTKDEYESFKKQFELPCLNYLEVGNFLELADEIAKSNLFIGVQSMCWHIADGLKARRLLEVSPQYPNTWPTGGDGYLFAHQNTLEYFVSLFVNKKRNDNLYLPETISQ